MKYDSHHFVVAFCPTWIPHAASGKIAVKIIGETQGKSGEVEISFQAEEKNEQTVRDLKNEGVNKAISTLESCILFLRTLDLSLLTQSDDANADQPTEFEGLTFAFPIT